MDDRAPNKPIREPVASIDGHLVPVSQAALHVFDLGVVTGSSATEMVRTFGHVPFRLDDHLDRLAASMEGLGIETPPARDELSRIVARVLEHNAGLVPAPPDLGITIFVTAGKNLTYLGPGRREEARRPTVCVHTFPLPFELWAKKLEAGQHLVTPAARQIPAACIDPRIKCRSRAHWHIAEHQARAIAPEASALLLDLDGFITETSTANVFAVLRGTVCTPPPSKTLYGVSQQTVRELAAELDIPYDVRDLRPEDVSSSEEAFTSSTPYCLLPVTRFNGHTIGDGRPGPVFAALLGAWSRRVRLDIAGQIRGGAA